MCSSIFSRNMFFLFTLPFLKPRDTLMIKPLFEVFGRDSFSVRDIILVILIKCLHYKLQDPRVSTHTFLEGLG